MQSHRMFTFSDYLDIARRRWWMIVVPAILLAAIAYGGSFLMTNRYTSKTTVLVDHQKVPDAYVRSVITDDLRERLGTMQEQILSRTRLQDLINRFGLFKKNRDKVPMEVLVERLRKQITVTPVQADYAARSGGVPGFTISVVSDDPQLAQVLCSEVASMFMKENLRIRGALAQGTTDFLKSQLDNAKKDLDDQDRKLAEFKGRYLGQLPGTEQTNINMVASLSTQLETANQALSQAQQERMYVDSMLTGHLTPHSDTRGAGGPTTSSPSALQQQLTVLNQQIAAMEGRYTSNHPDVVKLRAQIAQVRQQLAAAPPPEVPSAQTPDPGDSPEVRHLRAQLRQLDLTIRDRRRQQERIQADLGMYQERLRLSPTVEEAYKKLTRDYQTALSFYNDLLTKYSQSEMATNLELRQEGEQFRVMDPPNLPERPTFPKRSMFATGGGFLGAILGLCVVAFLELGDKTFRSEAAVEFHLKLPVLAIMPKVELSKTAVPKKEHAKGLPAARHARVTENV